MHVNVVDQIVSLHDLGDFLLWKALLLQALAESLNQKLVKGIGRAANAFHQFLIQTFSQRLQEKGFSQEEVPQIMKAYDLIYYIDMHVTEQDFPGYFESIETLVKYFLKGIFAK